MTLVHRKALQELKLEDTQGLVDDKSYNQCKCGSMEKPSEDEVNMFEDSMRLKPYTAVAEDKMKDQRILGISKGWKAR